MKDIDWSVEFDLSMDGCDVTFWDLPKTAQEEILSCIAGDSYSGTFCDGDADINWAATFEVSVDGCDAKFWNLSETAQENIISCIRGDSYSGTFTD